MSKRWILQEADGCAERETTSPKPLAQANACGRLAVQGVEAFP